MQDNIGAIYQGLECIRVHTPQSKPARAKAIILAPAG